MSKLPPNPEKSSSTVEPGDKGFESLKWEEFCNRVNNQGEDPYKVMSEMGLDRKFFENLPSAEGISPTSDVIGLPFVEAVDERGESPTAVRISSAPPTTRGEIIRVPTARRTVRSTPSLSAEERPSSRGTPGEEDIQYAVETYSSAPGQEYTRRLDEETGSIEEQSADGSESSQEETFQQQRARFDQSPTEQLFSQRVENVVSPTSQANRNSPGFQAYDETTFHNITGLWFPGSANESRTRDARRMNIELDFNTPITNNPFMDINDVYITGRSLAQYEDWRDRQVEQGNIDISNETITINNIPGGRRTLRPFNGFGPFNPRIGEGFVEMPDSFWRWYGIQRHQDENYFFNRFRRRNRTTGGSRKKNKKLSKKRKPKNSKKRKPKKSKKKTKKRGGAPQDQDEMADFRSSPSPTRLPTRAEFTEFQLKKEILYELMLTLEIFSPGEFIPRERIYEDEDEVTGFENTVNVNRIAAQIIRNIIDIRIVPGTVDRYIDSYVQKIRALGMLDLTTREWEGMPLDRRAAVIRNLRFVALVPPFEED